MKNLRTYGRFPFTVALIHGGPGAPGEMAPVARELAATWGVLEPLQTAVSLPDQIEELKTVLMTHGDLPITLVGFSWGAWLSFMVTAAYPTLVKQLILVGSGSFDEQYAIGMQDIRLSRLTDAERIELDSLLTDLDDPAIADKRSLFARFGALFSKADAFDPLPERSELIAFQAETYRRVWPEAAELRRSGRLLSFAEQIVCPVTAVHGDYDPHPAAGVQEPLAAVVSDFQFVLLPNCGHKPWIERQAKDAFYKILRQLLT